ncbi:hypothetical protein I3843_05G172900 [Carya illinoinensis]|nr:hypothetical protein I3843_05G172900 [Carya illinoinensis]
MRISGRNQRNQCFHSTGFGDFEPIFGLFLVRSLIFMVSTRTGLDREQSLPKNLILTMKITESEIERRGARSRHTHPPASAHDRLLRSSTRHRSCCPAMASRGSYRTLDVQNSIPRFNVDEIDRHCHSLLLSRLGFPRKVCDQGSGTTYEF